MHKSKKYLITIGIIMVILLGIFLGNSSKEVKFMDYNSFLEKVSNKEITTIYINEDESNLMKVYDKDNNTWVVSNPKTPTFKEEMLKSGIDVEEYSNNGFSIFFISMLVIIFLFFIFRSFSSQKEESSSSNVYKSFNPLKGMSLNTKPIKSDVTFNDVAGAEVAKTELKEIVDYLINPSEYANMGVKVRKGIILTGSPGTGKTLLAKALAGEANVPFYSLNGSDFVQMYVGVGAARVRELFATLRENSPCVLFIDEIDAVGKARSTSGGSSNDEREQTLNQLLSEMDGFKDNAGIVVIAATNRIDILDKALTRPGRFDKTIVVDNPDLQGRFDILKIHARNKNLSDDVDLMKLARRTCGFSGAELANVLNESGIIAIRKHKKIISWEDIDDAINVVIAGDKHPRNNMSDLEKQIVAYHETGHAFITKLMTNQVVEKITVVPTGNALGYILHGDEDDKMLQSKTDLFNNICISLGGRVAEKLMFGEDAITNGASNDLEKATKMAYQMVFSYGMSDLGLISLDPEYKDLWSSDIKNKAYKEVQNIIKKAEEKTTKYLTDNKELFVKLAKHLMMVESMDREDLEEFLNQDSKKVVNLMAK